MFKLHFQRGEKIHRPLPILQIIAVGNDETTSRIELDVKCGSM